MQRTVQVTKRSVGKRKAELHTSYFKLYSPTCRTLCRPQNWLLFLWFKGWEIQTVRLPYFLYYSLLSLLPSCQHRVVEGTRTQYYDKERNVLWDIRVFHLGQFRVHLCFSKPDLSSCQGVLKEKAMSIRQRRQLEGSGASSFSSE